MKQLHEAGRAAPVLAVQEEHPEAQQDLLNMVITRYDDFFAVI